MPGVRLQGNGGGFLMTVALTGAGGLFTKLGHWGQWLNNINALAGGSLTVDGRASNVTENATTRGNTIEADYAAGTPQYPVIDTLQTNIAAFQGSAAGFKSYVQKVAQDTLIDMVNTDTRLAQKTVPAALTILIQQMVTAAASVKANVPALGAQTAAGSPTGNPGIVGSVRTGAGTYSGMEYSLAETIRFACSADAQSGGAAANQERFTVTGATAQTDPLAFNW